jgi:hypothetical protein
MKFNHFIKLLSPIPLLWGGGLKMRNILSLYGMSLGVNVLEAKKKLNSFKNIFRELFYFLLLFSEFCA